MERSERPQAQCRRSASTRLKSEHRDARTDERERDVEREREKKQEAGLPPSRMQVKFVFVIYYAISNLGFLMSSNGENSFLLKYFRFELI